MRAVQGPRDLFWQDCVGADHGPLMLRTANQLQLRMVQREIGFKYVRFHGILTHTHVYRESHGTPVYDFSEVDSIYAAVLAAGMKPFVEISFMPEPLASGHKTIFYWKGNGSPPTDYGKWAALMTAFTRNLETRFGKTEVESWRFEVWNEPNLDGFWTHGDQQAYFHLYDVTARAIKNVDPALLVGGPATAGAAWVPQFLDHARATGSPVDFITTHAYGVEAGFLDAEGKADNELSKDPGAIVNDVLNVRHQVTAAGRPTIPVYFTEWSTSYSPRDPIHDAYLSAPYILEKLRRVQGAVQSMSYWTYTDLFEEAGPPPTSFQGGFGLVNREGIRKSAFFAYRYLNELGREELRDSDPESWLTRDGKSFSGLIWNYTPPNQSIGDRTYFRELHPSRPLPAIHLLVSSLDPGAYRLSVFRTGYRSNDAYSRYIGWGLPANLTPTQLATLQHLTRDLPETSLVVHVDSSGVFRRQISIRTNDIILVKLTRVTAARSSGIRPESSQSQSQKARVSQAAPIERRSAPPRPTSHRDALRTTASETPT